MFVDFTFVYCSVTALCYFTWTYLFIICSVTVDPLLLEMKVEQLELRLQQVEEAQAALLARLEQYESREATVKRAEHQETYSHQYPPWSLDYDPLTDTTGFYSPGQPCSPLSQSTHHAYPPGQQQQPWGQLSQAYTPGQQSWSQTYTPGEQSRSLLSHQTSVKKGQVSTLPSSEIDKALLSSIESVAHTHHHLCVPSKATTLAVKLARKAVFGDSVMSRCTPYGARDFPGLPTTELAELKETIRNLFPVYWNKPQEFEVLWTKCVDAIGRAPLRLMPAQTCTFTGCLALIKKKKVSCSIMP